MVLSVYWNRITNAFNEVLYNNPAGEIESGTGSVERLLEYLKFKQQDLRDCVGVPPRPQNLSAKHS